MAIEDVHAYFSPYEWCNGFEDQYKSDQWEYLSTRGRFWAITQKLGRHFQNEPKLGIHYWQGFLPYLPYITKEEMHGIIQCYEQMVTSWKWKTPWRVRWLIQSFKKSTSVQISSATTDHIVSPWIEGVIDSHVLSDSNYGTLRKLFIALLDVVHVRREDYLKQNGHKELVDITIERVEDIIARTHAARNVLQTTDNRWKQFLLLNNLIESMQLELPPAIAQRVRAIYRQEDSADGELIMKLREFVIYGTIYNGSMDMLAGREDIPLLWQDPDKKPTGDEVLFLC